MVAGVRGTFDSDKHRYISVEQALASFDTYEEPEYDSSGPIPGSERLRVHTFITAFGILMGADCDLSYIEALMKDSRPELAGPHMTAMKHGIVLLRPGERPLFIATKEATS